MYRVYAEFASRGAADRAADRLRSTAPGIGRISLMRKSPFSGKTDASGGFDSAGALFSPNTYYQNSAYPLMAAQENLSPTREQYFQSADGQEHLICAEGSRDAAEQAAHLLRAFGGISITIQPMNSDRR